MQSPMFLSDYKNKYTQMAQDFCSSARLKNGRIVNYATIFTTQETNKKTGQVGIFFSGNRLNTFITPLICRINPVVFIIILIAPIITSFIYRTWSFVLELLFSRKTVVNPRKTRNKSTYSVSLIINRQEPVGLYIVTSW